MKNLILTFILLAFVAIISNAQNTFPTSGFAGSGTTTPTAQLHVRSNQAVVARIERSLNQNSAILFNNPSNEIYFGLASSGFFGFSASANIQGQAFLKFDPTFVEVDPVAKFNGNVGIGIGSATPTNALEVNGTILAEEIKVEDAFPDYVFEEGYDVPSLEEEEAFIKENGHLMGFESAKEMDGEVKLGEVTLRQQEKIETMMLQLIELNNRLKALEAENANLKKELSKNK